MKLIASIHEYIFNLYANLLLRLDKRDEELTFLLSCEESSSFSVLTRE